MRGGVESLISGCSCNFIGEDLVFVCCFLVLDARVSDAAAEAVGGILFVVGVRVGCDNLGFLASS